MDVAGRVGGVGGGKGIRVYEVRKEWKRHLVDVRPVCECRDTQSVEAIKVLSPEELIASKVTSYISRFGKSKSWTYRRDLTLLLLRIPELKVADGKVQNVLNRLEAGEASLEFWAELVASDLAIENDDDLNF